MRRTVLVLVALAMLAAAPVLAQAVVDEAQREAIRGVPDRWGLQLGGFWPTFETKVRLNGETGTGTEIDLEKDLALDKSLMAVNFSAFYRFGDHSRLDVTYVPWDRKKTTTINKEIQWGDVTYEAGAEITAQAKAQLLNAIYRYSFFNNGRVTFGLNGGISALWTEISLSGEGTITGEGSVAGTIAEKKDVIFPIPVLGVHFDMTLTKRLFWRAEGNFFAASISGYDGNLNELATSIVYFPTRNVGVGAGFASTRYDVKKSGDNGGDVRVRYGFSGVNAYVQVAF